MIINNETTNVSTASVPRLNLTQMIENTDNLLSLLQKYDKYIVILIKDTNSMFSNREC